MNPKKALIMAGGTGGHIFPGLALAEKLQLEGWSVEWIGTEHKMEAEIVPKHNIVIHFIDIMGVRGNGFARLVKAPFMLLKAVFQAHRVINKMKPDVVIGFGGYASGPGGVAAWLSGTPLIIHEQNAVAGMTNRWLSKLAKHTLLAFPNALKTINSKRTEIIGNPVRKNIAELNAQPKRQLEQGDLLHILVIGGSLGARALNQTLPRIFSEVSKQGFRFKIRHQVGKNNSEKVSDDYQQNMMSLDDENLVVEEFIDDMRGALSWADLVICRAGALTVSELAASANVGIFVPLPIAVDDHQTANANWLVEQDAGKIVQQSQLKQKLPALLMELMTQPQRINKMQQNARHQAILSTTEHMFQLSNKFGSS